MVSKLLFDECEHTDPLGHNDPFYSIDFGDPSVRDSDGNAPTFVGVTALDHNPAKGIRILQNSTVTFPLTNPIFSEIYTNRVDTLLVAIQYSNWMAQRNDGIWQLVSNWPPDLAESEAVDPKNLVMSLNPRNGANPTPYIQFMEDSTDTPLKDYFVQFYGAASLSFENAYHWVYTFLDFNTGEMRLAQDNREITVGFSTIYLPYEGWANPANNDEAHINKPVRRNGYTPNAFRLRKGDTDYWVKRIRIFKNLHANECMAIAWRRTRDLV